MVIEPIRIRDEATVDTLLWIWEASVQATHDFITSEDRERLSVPVRQALQDISVLLCAVDENNTQCGFMGVEGTTIEMLFIHPAYRGQGIGKAFIDYAIDKLHSSHVDVNEQNLQAVGFYKHVGFVVARRSACDGYGNPFPILHMER